MKFREIERGWDADEVATRGGARALGLQGQIGELERAAQADFAVVSLKGSHQIPVVRSGEHAGLRIVRT